MDDIKINDILPEDAKWEAVGKGFVEALMDKQRRIDRLENLIFVLHSNICRKQNFDFILEDTNDISESFCCEILQKYENLKDTI